MEAYPVTAKQIACPVVLIIKKLIKTLQCCACGLCNTRKKKQNKTKKQNSENGRVKLVSRGNMITDKMTESFGNGNKIKSAYL